MPTHRTVRVDAAAALARARAALAPYDPADADLAARALVAGDASGWPEFGLALLVRELRDTPPGDADRSALPASSTVPTVPSARATATVDARHLPGPVALATAVRRAGVLARAHGVGVVAVRHAGGTGRVGAYVRALAEDGLVGVALAQSGPTVAPYGGTAPVVGTNPLAVAVPRAGDGTTRALVVDAATGTVTLAEARRHAEHGTPLPDGAALDADGRPTRDARSVGTLLPAGLLGSLLGLTVETLAGLLSGARGDTVGRGLWVLALDPLAFGVDDLADRTELLSQEWHRAGGHVPGSRPEAAAFDVDRDVWEALAGGGS
ncbi:Ldh family oxidoreductase [Cellulosimicrobium sp. Marseille-Q8652]